MRFPSHSAPVKTPNCEFKKHFRTAFVIVLLIDGLFWTEILKPKQYQENTNCSYSSITGLHDERHPVILHPWLDAGFTLHY